MDSGAENDAPEAPADAAEQFLERATSRMADAINRLEAGSPSQVRMAQRALRELRQTLWLLVDERTRLDKLRNTVAGLVADGDAGGDGDGGRGRGGRRLDLVAARDEIGRRLAGLRAAGDGG